MSAPGTPSPAIAAVGAPGLSQPGVGYDFAHAIVDDHSRLAYVELLSDERAETVSAFVERALEWFQARGKSECPDPDRGGGGGGGGGGGEGTPDCDPNYSGCLDPNASDYHCKGGSGDGPKYTGRVEVLGNDHYGLDSDGDGVGCES